MATDTSNFNFQGIGIVGATSIHGCTVLGNVNYNPLAVVDDGSCIALVLGCTDPLACNFDDDAGANFDDGSCEYCSCQNNPGCDDPLACNYDPTVSCNDGTCVGQSGCIDPLYDLFNSANTCDCSGDVNGNDNTCCGGLLGCTDLTASNYDASATVDDDSCVGCIYGCTDSDDFNYDASATCDDGSCIASVYGCTDSTANNDDDSANIDDGSCIYTVYGCTDDTASNWYGSVPANTTLIDDGSCQYLGCTDPLACNYDSAANVDDGSCILPAGCDDPLFLEYDPLVTYCPDNTNDCQNLIVNGCMECGTIWEGQNSGQFCNGVSAASSLGATNYNPLANVNSGCTYPTLGCMDPTACNYNSAATVSDGSCTYAAANANCAGACLAGFSDFGDGCVGIETGCTDDTQFGYDALANTDDGSCTAFVYGCLDATASNFGCNSTMSAGATEPCNNLDYTYYPNTDDGSCDYTVYGCMDDTAYNYDPLAEAQGDYACQYGGCMDPAACGYNPDALYDDGSCGVILTTFPNVEHQVAINEIAAKTGCTDPTATNYDLAHVCDDGSCLYPPPCPALADSVHYGRVFWVSDPNDPYCTGLVIQDGGSSTGQENDWGCHGTSISTGTAIGTGQQNTLNIIAACPGSEMILDLANTNAGYGPQDWFIPSKDEMYEAMDKIGYDPLNQGNFGLSEYMWTSSEVNSTNAWTLKDGPTGTTGAYPIQQISMSKSQTLGNGPTITGNNFGRLKFIRAFQN